MSNLALAELPDDWDELVENLVTEDDEPVDNVISAKQQRLLVEPLYTSWQPLPEEGSETDEPRKFIVDSNVGVFSSVTAPPIVPDMFLSLDVELFTVWTEKRSRSYFIWEYGKAPEIVVEIVSNKKGGEVNGKMRRYATLGISYYVVYDPMQRVIPENLRVYELGFGGRRYQLRRDFALPIVGLSLTLWRGNFEGTEIEWLRWCDAEGNMIPTGAEKAALAQEQASVAEQRAERLAAKLRELGVDPTQF